MKGCLQYEAEGVPGAIRRRGWLKVVQGKCKGNRHKEVNRLKGKNVSRKCSLEFFGQR